MRVNCPLCSNLGLVYFKNDKTYYRCKECYGIFIDKNCLISLEAEKKVYEKHENKVDDKNYQKFVSPITLSIIRDFSIDSKGLDFGSGSGPVLSKVLQDKNYFIKQYDPFFHNYPEVLEEKYDYIGSCEVIEHFHNPYKEFKLLKGLLKKDSKLYCMTELYIDGIDFSSWYYKNDPTHVFFYNKKTFEWIRKEFDFSSLKIDGRLITFEN